MLKKQANAGFGHIAWIKKSFKALIFRFLWKYRVEVGSELILRLDNVFIFIYLK